MLPIIINYPLGQHGGGVYQSWQWWKKTEICSYKGAVRAIVNRISRCEVEHSWCQEWSCCSVHFIQYGLRITSGDVGGLIGNQALVLSQSIDSHLQREVFQSKALEEVNGFSETGLESFGAWWSCIRSSID